MPFHIGGEERDRWLTHMLAAVDGSPPSCRPGRRATPSPTALRGYFHPAAEQLRNDTGLPITRAVASAASRAARRPCDRVSEPTRRTRSGPPRRPSGGMAEAGPARRSGAWRAPGGADGRFERAMAAVSVRDLRKEYGALAAVDGISFEIGEGEVYALLGENGAGKSTTVEILEGHRAADVGRRHRARRTIPAGAGATSATASASCCRPPGVEHELTVREAVVDLRLVATATPRPVERGGRARRPRPRSSTSASARCRAASGGGSTSPSGSSGDRRCCSSTSRRPASTRRPGARRGSSCASCAPAARRCC